MRPQDMFYFFGNPESQVKERAITTLVTYRKRKTLGHVYPLRGALRYAMRKLYRMRCTPGTLHVDGSITR